MTPIIFFQCRSAARIVTGLLLCLASLSSRSAPEGPVPGADPSAKAPAGPTLYCGGVSPISTPGGDGQTQPSETPKTLADLVAIAMKNNPDTRVAWTHAEEAALNLGIARSKYGPILAAEAATMYTHSTFPLPKNLSPSGYFKSDAEAFIPAVTLKWLIYDFGGRDAVLDEASQTLAGANFGFTATHRKVSILVTQQFFRLATQIARKEAARASLDSAELVQKAAQARQDQGTGTAPETLQARASAAEARLQLEEADATVEDARLALLEATGVRPDASICVSIPVAGPSQAISDKHLDRLIDQAIATRPEVSAAVAKVSAGQAAIRQARSEYFPKISLTSNVAENVGRLRSAGGDWSSVTKPLYGIGLVFQVPIYDGSIRRSGVQEAVSKEDAAQAQLDGTKNQVVHEVVKAYNDLRVSLRRRQSSAVLMSAAQDSFDSTLDSYRHGLATMPELESAVASLARARMAVSEAGADVLTARAVLSFATGDMIDVEP
jgi:outer membrane protein TolC